MQFGDTEIFYSWFRQVVLSYIHVDGDFNPRRVTVVRVHGGLHPRRVHEEATLFILPRSSPTKDFPHSGRSSRSRRSPCPYKLLGSTPHLDGGSQATPNQSRRHHSPKVNRSCVDDELLALVLQMIVSPTLNSLSRIRLWWKKDLSGKQLGEGQKSRFKWQEWNLLISTHEQVVLSQKMNVRSCVSFLFQSKWQ